MNIKGLSIVAGVLLILAILTFWPYGYYIFLRWAVCGIAVYVAYQIYKNKLFGWLLTFAAIAIIFNPIFPVAMNKSSWVAVDLVCAIVFFFSAYQIKEK